MIYSTHIDFGKLEPHTKTRSREENEAGGEETKFSKSEFMMPEMIKPLPVTFCGRTLAVVGSGAADAQ